MKAIILAAGEGKRLRPFTKDKPKCMVSFQGKPIIEHILDCLSKNAKLPVAVVGGYKQEKLKCFIKELFNNNQIFFYENPDFFKTNMVYTLFCAREEFDDDIIISYSDIVYGQDVLDKLIESEADISVVVDKKWRKLWEKRMNNPLSDAETLKIGDSGQIVEIGKKAESYNEIEGQYIGLIKISKKVLKKISVFYDNLDKNNLYDGKNFENIYMTTFIQLLIDNGFRVTPVEIDGGWVEIDSVEDLKKLKDYTI